MPLTQGGGDGGDGLSVSPETNPRLVEVFGTSSRVKVLSYVVTWDDDFTTMEVVQDVGLSYPTVSRELKSLEALGIVYKSRIAGRTVLWRTNNQFTMAMIDLSEKLEAIDGD